MSLSTSYSEFNQQLLLKLTLGQQFKQTVKVPNELQVYAPKQIDSAQDLLVLNQYWVLMQQAGYQAQDVPEILQKNIAEIDQIENEKQLDNQLVQILKWAVAQESPFLYQDWVIQIFKLAPTTAASDSSLFGVESSTTVSKPGVIGISLT